MFLPLLISIVVTASLAALYCFCSRGKSKERLKFEGALPATGTVIGKVVGLYIYPVKSGQAVFKSVAELDSCGMTGDRRLMVLNSKGGKQTQLTCPKLARLKATFPDDNHVLLSCGEEELSVSLTPDPNAKISHVEVVVTGCQVVDLGDDAARFLDRITGRSGNRLVKQAPGSYRYIKDYPLWFGSSPSSQDRTSLQDFGPLLMTNEASLKSINTKIEPEQRSGMDRFRANVVIETKPEWAWVEDHIKTIQLGDRVFRWMAPCIRCLQPCIDQTTGEAHYITKGMRFSQPTKALREFHPGSLKRSFLGFQSVPKGGAGGFAPAFGVLLTHALPTSGDASFGAIAVGDNVKVLEYHRPSILQRLFGM